MQCSVGSFGEGLLMGGRPVLQSGGRARKSESSAVNFFCLGVSILTMAVASRN